MSRVSGGQGPSKYSTNPPAPLGKSAAPVYSDAGQRGRKGHASELRDAQVSRIVTEAKAAVAKNQDLLKDKSIVPSAEERASQDAEFPMSPQVATRLQAVSAEFQSNLAPIMNALSEAVAAPNSFARAFRRQQQIEDAAQSRNFARAAAAAAKAARDHSSAAGSAQQGPDFKKSSSSTGLSGTHGTSLDGATNVSNVYIAQLQKAAVDAETEATHLREVIAQRTEEYNRLLQRVETLERVVAILGLPDSARLPPTALSDHPGTTAAAARGVVSAAVAAAVAAYTAAGETARAPGGVLRVLNSSRAAADSDRVEVTEDLLYASVDPPFMVAAAAASAAGTQQRAKQNNLPLRGVSWAKSGDHAATGLNTGDTEPGSPLANTNDPSSPESRMNDSMGQQLWGGTRGGGAIVPSNGALEPSPPTKALLQTPGSPAIMTSDAASSPSGAAITLSLSELVAVGETFLRLRAANRFLAAQRAWLLDRIVLALRACATGGSIAASEALRGLRSAIIAGFGASPTAPTAMEPWCAGAAVVLRPVQSLGPPDMLAFGAAGAAEPGNGSWRVSQIFGYESMVASVPMPVRQALEATRTGLVRPRSSKDASKGGRDHVAGSSNKAVADLLRAEADLRVPAIDRMFLVPETPAPIVLLPFDRAHTRPANGYTIAAVFLAGIDGPFVAALGAASVQAPSIVHSPSTEASAKSRGAVVPPEYTTAVISTRACPSGASVGFGDSLFEGAASSPPRREADAAMSLDAAANSTAAAAIFAAVTALGSPTAAASAMQKALENALARVHQTVVNIATAHEGRLLESTPVSWLAFFSSPLDGARFAVALQSELAQLQWPNALNFHPSTCAVFSAKRDLIIAGPRVAIAVDLAERATLHTDPLTLRPILAGVSVRRAAALVVGVPPGHTIVTPRIASAVEDIPGADLAAEFVGGAPILERLPQKSLAGTGGEIAALANELSAEEVRPSLNASSAAILDDAASLVPASPGAWSAASSPPSGGTASVATSGSIPVFRLFPAKHRPRHVELSLPPDTPWVPPFSVLGLELSGVCWEHRLATLRGQRLRASVALNSVRHRSHGPVDSLPSHKERTVVLFAELCQGITVWERDPTVLMAVVERLQKLYSRLIPVHEGIQLLLAADCVVLAFGSVSTAVNFALDLHAEVFTGLASLGEPIDTDRIACWGVLSAGQTTIATSPEPPPFTTTTIPALDAARDLRRVAIAADDESVLLRGPRMRVVVGTYATSSLLGLLRGAIGGSTGALAPVIALFGALASATHGGQTAVTLDLRAQLQAEMPQVSTPVHTALYRHVVPPSHTESVGLMSVLPRQCVDLATIFSKTPPEPQPRRLVDFWTSVRAASDEALRAECAVIIAAAEILTRRSAENLRCAAAPTGTVSIVAVTLDGLAALLDVSTGLASAALQLASTLLRETASTHAATELACIGGDTFLLAFTSARAAYMFAGGLHRALLDLPWPVAALRSSGAAEIVIAPNGSVTHSAPQGPLYGMPHPLAATSGTATVILDAAAATVTMSTSGGTQLQRRPSTVGDHHSPRAGTAGYGSCLGGQSLDSLAAVVTSGGVRLYRGMRARVGLHVAREAVAVVDRATGLAVYPPAVTAPAVTLLLGAWPGETLCTPAAVSALTHTQEGLALTEDEFVEVSPIPHPGADPRAPYETAFRILPYSLALRAAVLPLARPERCVAMRGAAERRVVSTLTHEMQLIGLDVELEDAVLNADTLSPIPQKTGASKAMRVTLGAGDELTLEAVVSDVYRAAAFADRASPDAIAASVVPPIADGVQLVASRLQRLAVEAVSRADFLRSVLLMRVHRTGQTAEKLPFSSSISEAPVARALAAALASSQVPLAFVQRRLIRELAMAGFSRRAAEVLHLAWSHMRAVAEITGRTSTVAMRTREMAAKVDALLGEQAPAKLSQARKQQEAQESLRETFEGQLMAVHDLLSLYDTRDEDDGGRGRRFSSEGRFPNRRRNRLLGQTAGQNAFCDGKSSIL